MKLKQKKAWSIAVGVVLAGGAATWYLKGKEKRQKENRDIDFQKVVV